MKNAPILIAALLGLIGNALAAPTQSDLDLILDGVTELEYGNAAPGALNLDETRALPLVEKDGRVLGAIAESEGSRLVAFSHGMFLKSFHTESNRALGLNAIRWAGKSKSPSVGLVGRMNDLPDELKKAGVEFAPVDFSRPLPFDVVLLEGLPNLEDGDYEKLRQFLAKGKGLVVATTPWASARRFEDFRQHPINRVSLPLGIYFYPDINGKSEPQFRPDPQLLLDASLEALVSLLSSEGATEDTLKQLEKAKQLEGDQRKKLILALQRANSMKGPIIPSKEKPIFRDKDLVKVAIMRLEDHFNQTAPAGEMYAIPAAENYPGAIPDKAQRVTRTFKIDGNYKGWLSGRTAGGWTAPEMRPTGLYAAPGEVVIVRVPQKFAGKGLEVVIGAYRGSIERKERWHRYPRLMRRVAMDAPETQASNGLGGLITIAVPRDAKLGEIDIRIENAVEAPLYVHGKTNLAEWRNLQRSHPAPWAELASERMIIALPSEYIRQLNNPDEVTELWNRIIDVSAELVQVDRNNYRAERLVFDRQISAGAMHSSYPVAAHTGKSAELAVDADLLKTEGSWGFFHEYGHNHQHNLWFLPGTGETTCNLWSVYVYEELIGKNRNDTHRSVSPLRRTQLRNAYFRNGRKFEEEWKVWTALDTYLLIQEEFGWEPFIEVFDEYNKLAQAEWPRNQQQKNDQWVIRLSKAVGKNLEPYWRKWNLPITEKVAAELRGLPVWENHPVSRF
ncbi:MAG: M60 family metallopeptidase [Verrucomicrobiota bacterium]